MIEILREHFWAIWWLCVFVALNFPDAFVVINKPAKAGEE